MATDCIICGEKVTDATVFMALHKRCSRPPKELTRCERCGEVGHASAQNVQCEYFNPYPQRGWR